jgi:hypothetical protein
MKTIITSVKGPPLRRVLCSFLFGAAAFCIVPANIQAQAPPDIVWLTTGNTIAKYNADGTAINTNVITLQPIPMPPVPVPPYNTFRFAWIPYLGGILVSGPNLYVAAQWLPDMSPLIAIRYHVTWYFTYNIFTLDAGTGNGISSPFNFSSRFTMGQAPFGPAGMALSAPYPAGPSGGPYLYVANQSKSSITKINTTGGGNLYFINSTVTNPIALAVGGPNGNVLYVSNAVQLSDGYHFYISTYTADTGALINANFIQTTPVGSCHGLALKNNVFGVNSALYVSVNGGNAPGVYTYDAATGNPLNGPGPFVSVNGPLGIAIGSPPLNGQHPTLYVAVASQQDSAIYEFDATTGARLSYSIKLSGAPNNITVEPATRHRTAGLRQP